MTFPPTKAACARASAYCDRFDRWLDEVLHTAATHRAAGPKTARLAQEDYGSEQS